MGSTLLLRDAIAATDLPEGVLEVLNVTPRHHRGPPHRGSWQLRRLKFGPVASLTIARDAERAVELDNGSEFGHRWSHPERRHIFIVEKCVLSQELWMPPGRLLLRPPRIGGVSV